MHDHTTPKPGCVRHHELPCGRYVNAVDLLTAGLVYLDGRPADEAPILAGLLAWLAPIIGE